MTMEDLPNNDSTEKMKIELVYSQACIHAEILRMIDQARERLTFLSMMTEHGDPELVQALNKASQRGVEVLIFHSENPYVVLPLQEESSNIHVIPMHGKKMRSYISDAVGHHIDDFHYSLTHSRMLLNDTHCLFGGVDFNRKCDTKEYVQNAIKIQLDDSFRETTSKIRDHLKQHKDLHQFEFLRTGPIIGTSMVSCSASERLYSLIDNAKEVIFIENQYIQHPGLLQRIVSSQQLYPNLKVIIIGNQDFEVNPYHPCKYHNKIISKLVNVHLRLQTSKGLSRLKRCNYQFRVYTNRRYVHNKVFIIDDTFVMGTLNFHERSLDAACTKRDCEMGVLLEHQEQLSEEYMARALSETVEVKRYRVIGPIRVCKG